MAKYLPALGRYILGYLGKGIQTFMAQGRSTKINPMIKWIRASSLSKENSFSLPADISAKVLSIAFGETKSTTQLLCCYQYDSIV